MKNSKYFANMTPSSTEIITTEFRNMMLTDLYSYYVPLHRTFPENFISIRPVLFSELL